MKVIYNLFPRICLFVYVQTLNRSLTSAHPSISQGKISQAKYPASLIRCRSVSQSRLFCYQLGAVIRSARGTYRRSSRMTQHSTQHIQDTHHYWHYSFISIQFHVHIPTSISKLKNPLQKRDLTTHILHTRRYITTSCLCQHRLSSIRSQPSRQRLESSGNIVSHAFRMRAGVVAVEVLMHVEDQTRRATIWILDFQKGCAGPIADEDTGGSPVVSWEEDYFRSELSKKKVARGNIDCPKSGREYITHASAPSPRHS